MARQVAVILFFFLFSQILYATTSSFAHSEPWLYFYGRQDVVQLEHEIVFNETIIEEREQGMIEIQQQIGELNEMFKDLALLVHEQGTMLG